jgi:hypothetical protein
MSSRISFAPLAHDEIRLMNLQSRLENGHIDIRGNLTTHRLRDKPEYTALSYVCGYEATDDPFISFNDIHIQIRKSLFEAIKELMHDRQELTLWTDQICIDQADAKEKQQQIRLMSKIYAHAERTIGWLGAHSEDSLSAINQLLVLGVTTPGLTDSQDAYVKGLVAQFGLGVVHYITVRALGLDSPDGQELRSLFERDWFKRLWIIQEASLSRNLVIQCGHSTMAGGPFFEAVGIICSIITRQALPWMLKPYRNAYRILQLRREIAQGKLHSLPRLASTLSAWDCTKEEDRLGALFGLAFRNDPDGAWFNPPATDPGMNRYREVYTTFARDYMNGHQSHPLDFLHFVSCSDVRSNELLTEGPERRLVIGSPARDLPSWVPDWRVQTRPLTLLQDPHSDQSDKYAATSSDTCFERGDDAHALRLRARFVSKVADCGVIYNDAVMTTENRSPNWTVHHAFGSWWHHFKKYFPSTEYERIFASTLVMDGKVQRTERPGMSINPEDAPTLLGKYLGVLFNGLDADAIITKEDDATTEFEYHAEEVCRYRTMFITEDNRLGIGPLNIMPGDAVCLISGLKTPFLVRQHFADAGAFTLLGEAYVYGMMYEQAELTDQDGIVTLR